MSTYNYQSNSSEKLEDLGQELANILAKIARRSRAYERRSSGGEWIGEKTLTTAVNNAIYVAMTQLL